MAELELGVLARECLSQLPPDRAAMQTAVTAWSNRRNATDSASDGNFTTTDAGPGSVASTRRMTADGH